MCTERNVYKYISVSVWLRGCVYVCVLNSSLILTVFFSLPLSLSKSETYTDLSTAIVSFWKSMACSEGVFTRWPGRQSCAVAAGVVQFN